MAIAFQRKSLSKFGESNDYHDELPDQTVPSMGSTSVQRKRDMALFESLASTLWVGSLASHWLKGLERTLKYYRERVGDYL